MGTRDGGRTDERAGGRTAREREKVGVGDQKSHRFFIPAGRVLSRWRHRSDSCGAGPRLTSRGALPSAHTELASAAHMALASRMEPREWLAQAVGPGGHWHWGREHRARCGGASAGQSVGRSPILQGLPLKLYPSCTLPLMQLQHAPAHTHHWQLHYTENETNNQHETCPNFLMCRTISPPRLITHVLLYTVNFLLEQKISSHPFLYAAPTASVRTVPPPSRHPWRS